MYLPGGGGGGDGPALNRLMHFSRDHAQFLTLLLMLHRTGTT